MPYNNREKQLKYMRDYQTRRKEKIEKIAELKRLASQPITITSAVELAQKIKEL